MLCCPLAYKIPFGVRNVSTEGGGICPLLVAREVKNQMFSSLLCSKCLLDDERLSLAQASKQIWRNDFVDFWKCEVKHVRCWRNMKLEMCFVSVALMEDHSASGSMFDVSSGSQSPQSPLLARLQA